MRWMLLGGIVALGATACIVDTRPRGTVTYQTSGGVYAQPAQPAYVQPAQPAYVQPAQPAQPAYVAPAAQCVCRQGAMELCNGCDDNCNGIVDENCR